MRDSFMYGDLSEPEEQPQILTVLLIGFDGRRKVLTGSFDVLWREFMTGDGGQANSCTTKPCGYEYWCQLPLGTPESEAQPSPSVQAHLDRK